MTVSALANARKRIKVESDPEGLGVRDALVLAYHLSGLAAEVSEEYQERWTFGSTAVREGLENLVGARSDVSTFRIGHVEVVDGELPELGEQLRGLLTDVSAVLAEAVQSQSAEPWRRLRWAAVIDRLDEAVREIP